MNRRGFLGSILALGVAPAVVGSGVLMPVRKVLTLDRINEIKREILQHVMPAEIGQIDGLRIVFANRIWIADGRVVRGSPVFADQVYWNSDECFTVRRPKPFVREYVGVIESNPVEHFRNGPRPNL